MSGLTLFILIAGLILVIVYLVKKGLSFIDAVTIAAFIGFLIWFAFLRPESSDLFSDLV